MPQRLARPQIFLLKSVTCTVEQTGKSETTSMCLLLPLQMCPRVLLFFPFIITLFSYNILLVFFSFLSVIVMR